MMNKQERMRNALLGQAVADAIGDPFEFELDFESWLVKEYAEAADTIEYTDDTQMTLFTAEAIDMWMGSDNRDFNFQCENSYIDWWHTQTGDLEFVDNDPVMLFQFQELYSRKSPGTTCLTSMRDIALHGTRKKNNSMGCGSVMRVLPFAAIEDVEEAVKLAVISGQVTHDHILSDESVERLVRIYHALLREQDINHLIPESVKNATCITDLGEGWIAPECFKMALWAFLDAEDFDDLLTKSICHNGDSDSVAAVAGALWGISGFKIKYSDKLRGMNPINHVLNYDFMRVTNG